MCDNLDVRGKRCMARSGQSLNTVVGSCDIGTREHVVAMQQRRIWSFNKINALKVSAAIEARINPNISLAILNNRSRATSAPGVGR